MRYELRFVAVKADKRTGDSWSQALDSTGLENAGKKIKDMWESLCERDKARTRLDLYYVLCMDIGRMNGESHWLAPAYVDNVRSDDDLSEEMMESICKTRLVMDYADPITTIEIAD